MVKLPKNIDIFTEYLNKKATIIFVFLALVFGAIFIISVPPLFGSDEIVHFPRAYSIQNGSLWTTKLNNHDFGGYVPIQIKTFNDAYRELAQNNSTDINKLKGLNVKYKNERLRSDNKKEYLSFTSSGVYSPWSYLPAVIGIKIAHTLNLPMVWYVYIARFACLVVWVCLVVFTLKLLPQARLFIIALALLPTSLVQAGTIGMDGVVNGLSWLLIAIFLSVMLGNIKINKIMAGGLVLLSLFLATTKQGYVLLGLLPTLIPYKHFYFNKKATIFYKIFLAVTLTIATIWYLSKTGPIAGIMHFVQRPGINVDSHKQIIYILHHPIQTLIIICIQPFSLAYSSIYAGLVGVLTNKQIYLPITTMIMLYITLIISYLTVKFRFSLNSNKRYYMLLMGGIFIVTFVFINLALYVSFTKVGLNKVEGVQGRYLLPLLPLGLLYPLMRKKQLFTSYQNYLSCLVYLGVIIGLISTTVAI
ncbi:MAG: DUF2142 domain-containing protein [Candidatus Saccharimonadales bacterium]